MPKVMKHGATAKPTAGPSEFFEVHVEYLASRQELGFFIRIPEKYQGFCGSEEMEKMVGEAPVGRGINAPRVRVIKGENPEGVIRNFETYMSAAVSTGAITRDIIITYIETRKSAENEHSWDEGHPVKVELAYLVAHEVTMGSQVRYYDGLQASADEVTHTSPFGGQEYTKGHKQVFTQTRFKIGEEWEPSSGARYIIIPYTPEAAAGLKSARETLDGMCDFLREVYKTPAALSDTLSRGCLLGAGK
jgi:hypothetical protein